MFAHVHHVAGLKRALSSSRTPAHLKPHIQQRLSEAMMAKTCPNCKGTGKCCDDEMDTPMKTNKLTGDKPKGKAPMMTAGEIALSRKPKTIPKNGKASVKPLPKKKNLLFGE